MKSGVAGRAVVFLVEFEEAFLAVKVEVALAMVAFHFRDNGRAFELGIFGLEGGGGGVVGGFVGIGPVESELGSEGLFELEDGFLVAEDNCFHSANWGCLERAYIARARGSGFAAVEGVVDLEFAAGDFSVGDVLDVDGGEVGIELAAFPEDSPEG